MFLIYWKIWVKIWVKTPWNGVPNVWSPPFPVLPLAAGWISPPCTALQVQVHRRGLESDKASIQGLIQMSIFPQRGFLRKLSSLSNKPQLCHFLLPQLSVYLLYAVVCSSLSSLSSHTLTSRSASPAIGDKLWQAAGMPGSWPQVATDDGLQWALPSSTCATNSSWRSQATWVAKFMHWKF